VPQPFDDATGRANLTFNQVPNQTPSVGRPLVASEVSYPAVGNTARPEPPEDSRSNFIFPTEEDSAMLSNRYRTPFPQGPSHFLDNGNLPPSPTQSSSLLKRGTSGGPKVSQSVDTIDTGPSFASTGMSTSRRARSREHQDEGRPKRQRVNKKAASQDFPPQDLPPQDLLPNSERPFACPYFKRNPVRYQACRQRQCKGINRLKSVP
jgi:hypothetical protein